MYRRFLEFLRSRAVLYPISLRSHFAPHLHVFFKAFSITKKEPLSQNADILKEAILQFFIVNASRYFFIVYVICECIFVR